MYLRGKQLQDTAENSVKTNLMILVHAKYYSLIESRIRGIGHVACMGRREY
jgi:hypothetical protein